MLKRNKYHPLARHQIPLMSVRTAGGLTLTGTEVADTFSIVPGGWGVGTLYLLGEEAAGAETETSTLAFEYTLPPDYLAGQDVKVIAQAKYTKDADCSAFTIDCEIYELSDAGAATAILASSPEALATAFADHTFTATATALLPGDRILAMIQTVVTNTGGGDASRSFIGAIEVQADGSF